MSSLTGSLPIFALLFLGLFGCTRDSVGAGGTDGTPPGPGTPTPTVKVADLILENGKVVTVDPDQPEVQAVAIKGDRILAVGSTQEIKAHRGQATKVLDLNGRLAIPGFIEGHGHFTSLGQALMVLDLNGTRNWDEIVVMVESAAHHAKPGQWILGRGWHQEKWDKVPEPNVDGVPIHTSLSEASPENPVLLRHASGHAAFANAKAMELAKIGPKTKDPPGGTILRDAKGNPTGGLREKAQLLVSKVKNAAEAKRPAADQDARRLQQVKLAGRECLANGVTSFHDAGSNFETIDMFRKLGDAGELPVRLYVMVRYASNEEMDEKLPKYRMVNGANGFLTVRSIKRQIDGALGPHGAWLLEPYADLPGNRGLTLETPEDIAGTTKIALEHGYQVNTHAIGDRANREILNIYAKALESAKGQDLRWRIEHAQHIHPDDVPRFKELGLVASMQGIHCTSDAPYVLKRLGEERAESGAYLWRTLLDAGVVVSNGTDVPVENISPIASFYASVTRHLADGSDFYPKQRMTRAEALHSYTMANAYAAFEDHEKGSVTPGKYADIVVLSRDIMAVPDDQILDTRVDVTILGGKVAYERS